MRYKRRSPGAATPRLLVTEKKKRFPFSVEPDSSVNLNQALEEYLTAEVAAADPSWEYLLIWQAKLHQLPSGTLAGVRS